MDLYEFIIAVLSVVDEMLPVARNAQRLRQRGPAPRLTDSEVITMEVVGEYLGWRKTACSLPTSVAITPISFLRCAQGSASSSAKANAPQKASAAKR